jgi:C4-type Zn-finger protein
MDCADLFVCPKCEGLLDCDATPFENTVIEFSCGECGYRVTRTFGIELVNEKVDSPDPTAQGGKDGP